MSISLLKRYKNEVKTVLSKTKKLIKAEWGDDFEILFTIKSPYSGYDYDSNDGATSCSITLRVNKVFANKELVGKIKAVEDKINNPIEYNLPTLNAKVRIDNSASYKEELEILKSIKAKLERN